MYHVYMGFMNTFKFIKIRERTHLFLVTVLSCSLLWGDHDDDTMEAKDNDSNEVYCHVKCDAVNYTDLHESLHNNDDSKVMYIKNGCN